MMDERARTQKTIFILHDMISKMTSLKASIQSGIVSKGLDTQFFVHSQTQLLEIEKLTKRYLADQEDRFTLYGGHFHVPEQRAQRFHSIK